MSSCIFGKRFILALVLSFLLLSTNIAFASQKIDFSTLDVSISFPDSVVAMYRTMDDIDAASLGFSKNDVLTELSAENCECMAYSSLHDIWFHIGTPSLASFDFSNMSDQEKHETIENYRSYYLDYGYALDSIEFVNTPNTTLLRLQGSISLPSFTRHLIQYYYTYDDYCFFLQAASEGVPFSEHEIAMCDAISKTISYDSFALPFDDLISFENYSSNASKIQFSIPALWYHSETIVEDNDIVERFEPYGSDGFTDILYGDIDISAIAKDAGKANSPNNIIADVFNMTNSEFEEFSINSLTSAYVDPKDAYIYRDTIGSHDYIISCFDVELEVDNKIHVIPHTIFLHVDFNNAYSHYFTYKTMETDLNSAYIEDVWDMIDSVQYPIPDENLSEASPLIRTAHYICYICKY